MNTYEGLIDPVWESLKTTRPDIIVTDCEDVDSTIDNTAYEDLSFLLQDRDQWPTPPSPSLLSRTDGSHLLYAGKVSMFYGDPESGKTWIAKTAVAQALCDGGNAVMIDIDHNGYQELAMDLVKLGAPLEALADPQRFRIYVPEDRHDFAAIRRDLATWNATIVVIDSVGELIPMFQGDSDKSDHISDILRQTASAYADTGAAVVLIDHLPKGSPGQGRNTKFPVGGHAKKRAANGVMVLVTLEENFVPGRVGSAKLTIVKDRPGGVRSQCFGDVFGVFTMDSTSGSTIDACIEPKEAIKSDTGAFLPVDVMEKVSVYAAARRDIELSLTDIRSGVKARDSLVGEAVSMLVKYGFMSSRQVSSNREKFVFVKDFDAKQSRTLPGVKVVSKGNSLDQDAF